MLDVGRELKALYGSDDLRRTGVVHVVHAARDERGFLNALRIGSTTPKSETDRFVLDLCRARADVIVTSAEILRREPQLSHRLAGPWAAALTSYRREVLAKTEPLGCAILTRTGELPYPHPVWSDGTRKWILTPPESEAHVRSRFGDRAQIVGLEQLDAPRACAWLAAEGLVLISVEAGPSTANKLYTSTPGVDELFLTEWETPTAQAELAGALPDDATLFTGKLRHGGTRRTEHGHTFRFERWARA